MAKFIDKNVKSECKSDQERFFMLPCPFCGSEGEFEYAEQDGGMGRAQCANKQCGVSFFDDHDSAIEKWNKRT